MKIALALSGGGFRATVFHLGVLARLALDDHDLFPQVTFLSTVSGGSLCGGLIYALSDFKWPTGQYYLDKVVPGARRLMTEIDIQGNLVSNTLTQIWTIFQTRTGALARLMQKYWGITGKLATLPHTPRWLINTCCYETGKSFRFEPHRMGDYVFGYADPGSLPLSDALAASAGFPGLIGYLPLDTSKYRWYRYTDRVARELFLTPAQHRERATEPVAPQFTKLHLWDGGAYDNQGLEGLMNSGTGWHENIDFLIVSEAAPKAQPTPYTWGVPALYRLMTGIMMEQVRSLRAQAVIEQMENHDQLGAYLRIGNSCEYVLTEAGRKQDIPAQIGQCLPKAEVEAAAHTPTMIRRLTEQEFERLFRHGYETADYTLYAYHADASARPVPFKFMGYAALQSRLKP
jgi:NTE family protein